MKHDDLSGKIMVVAGIDTAVGKTVATGLLARWFLEHGVRVITMKMVQTGNRGLSEDIREHRKLSGTELLEEDAMGETCPYVFSVPCSPHLAARLDGTFINTERIVKNVEQLASVYDLVLLETAGGLMVPLTEETMIIDLIEEQRWPVILVTSPRLGSINHTYAALEILHNRHISLQGVIYNRMMESETDRRITEDSRRLFTKRIQYYGYDCNVCDIPNIACTDSYCVDFSMIFPNMRGSVI